MRPNSSPVRSRKEPNSEQFDTISRTLKVRLQADNPGYRLRPDMFVDVEIPVRYEAALTVPSDAMLDTGLRKTVYVDHRNGYFEPRRVETGWRFGDRIEITRGLMEGERIVVSGNFLLDSESRLKAAAMGLPDDAPTDPVCGMSVDSRKAGTLKSDYQGVRYYFCSDSCMHEFSNNPGKYLKK
jgi:membrane fusion protein, copper/silver efflux system